MLADENHQIRLARPVRRARRLAVQTRTPRDLTPRLAKEVWYAAGDTAGEGDVPVIRIH